MYFGENRKEKYTHITNSPVAFTILKFEFLMNIYYDFFFNWQTEKKNYFEPVKSLFSFITARSNCAKKFVKTCDEFVICRRGVMVLKCYIFTIFFALKKLSNCKLDQGKFKT